MSDLLKPIRRRLSKLDLDEISLVPSGDNPHAKVVVAKADPDKTHDESEQARTLDHNEPQGAQGMSDESSTVEAVELPEDVIAYIEALESTVEELQSQSSLGEVLEGESEKEVVLAKADPAIRELVEKAEERAAAAEAIAKAERDERLRREYVAKAESLEHLGAPETLAEILKALHDAAPEVAPQVEALLTAANEQIAKGDLFSTFGSSATTEVDNRAAAAAEAIRKSDPTLTPEQAMVRAYESDPSLYTDA